MKKHFILSSMLALAMGIAQAQTQQPNSPAPMQGGTNDPRQGQRQTDVPPAAAQGMGPGGVNDQAAAQSFKGCLNGSAGSWTLTSDKGKTATLSGADNQLSPYQGQEVRIQGVQSSDGSITVSSIDKVSDACTNQSASNMNAQSSSTSQNDINNQSSTSTTNSTSQSTTATQPSSSADMSNQSTAPATATTPDSTTPDNSTTTMNSQSSTTSSSTAPGATTPPVSNQTPANSVGTGQTAPSSAQTPSTSTNDQNTASSTSTSNQNSTGNQNATSSDQGVRHYSDMDQNAGNNSSSANNKLPQTASPLPLLGFLGLGSLAAGLMSRRKK